MRRGATLTLGLRVYFMAMAQYLVGAWDDVLLTAEQAFSAAAIHPRRLDLPWCTWRPRRAAGRGAVEEAERHARRRRRPRPADYGQERLYGGWPGH